MVGHGAVAPELELFIDEWACDRKRVASDKRKRAMIFNMSIATFTIVHVLISLVGIIAGIIAMAGLLTSAPLRGWTTLFLVATILTSVTGFMFPFTTLLPSHIVGILSLVLLAIAVFALIVKRLTGVWRPVYVVTAMLSLYLNVFVLIIQSFQKVGPLKALAPTQTEPAFLLAQGVTLLLFAVAIIFGVIKFRPAAATHA